MKTLWFPMVSFSLRLIPFELHATLNRLPYASFDSFQIDLCLISFGSPLVNSFVSFFKGNYVEKKLKRDPPQESLWRPLPGKDSPASN